MAKIHEAQRIITRINPKRPIPRHIIIKLLKLTENLKVAKEKQLVMCKGALIRLSVDSSAENLPAREKWYAITERKKTCQ